MASKKTNSLLKSGNARMQPIRATQPFQLLQGSPARKSPCSSPTPRSTADSRVNIRNRWSPDLRSSPDRNDRKSPSSPSIKVSNRRSPSPSIRRTPSLDTLTGPYLTGQWPREFTSTTHQHAMRDKSTQTTPSDWSSENAFQSMHLKSNNKSGRSAAIGDNDYTQILKHIRTRTKKKSDKKERGPPVHGDHSALQQLPTSQSRSNPVSIAIGRTPRRQNSVEADKEIDMFISNFNSGSETRSFQGVTPPDGHRAPLPRSSTRTMETQTPQDIGVGTELLKDDVEPAEEAYYSLSSPNSSEQQPGAIPNSVLRSTAELDVKDSGISPCSKYACSPRPNNSYMFKREPPEGAESVKPFKEQDTQQRISPSCPDIKKINFNKSTLSAFTPLPKLMQAFSTTVMGPEQNNTNSLHASRISTLVSVNANNNANVAAPTSNNINGIPILTAAVGKADA